MQKLSLLFVVISIFYFSCESTPNPYYTYYDSLGTDHPVSPPTKKPKAQPSPKQPKPKAQPYQPPLPISGSIVGSWSRSTNYFGDAVATGTIITFFDDNTVTITVGGRLNAVGTYTFTNALISIRFTNQVMYNFDYQRTAYGLTLRGYEGWGYDGSYAFTGQGSATEYVQQRNEAKTANTQPYVQDTSKLVALLLNPASASFMGQFQRGERVFITRAFLRVIDLQQKGNSYSYLVMVNDINMRQPFYINSNRMLNIIDASYRHTIFEELTVSYVGSDNYLSNGIPIQTFVFQLVQ